jgi:hypothetical protein
MNITSLYYTMDEKLILTLFLSYYFFILLFIAIN